ncbi:P-loop containing nucleoside triphosphate hydrolase protein [Blakeslea trispora]|nr:P-loop containing nucleoside triphosphate hydrolase protein [Blakeslea trispora]
MATTQIKKNLPPILMGSNRLGNIVDTLLSVLEKASDEAFWNGIFGERVLNLLKRYFGSDVVFLGFVVYIAPIVGHQFTSLYYYCLNKVKENMYVSIQVSKDESGYNAIQEFISKHNDKTLRLRDVEGRCIVEDDDTDMQRATPPPQLQLFPLDESEYKIQYKGHNLWVRKMKKGNTDKDTSQYYYNNLSDFIGQMQSNPCVVITMWGRDLNLLKSFIQEWINTHFENEQGRLTIYKCMPTRYEGFEWSAVGSKELRPFSSVILKNGQKEHILKDIQTFRSRESWYSIRGIPYRRGYLLYGPPGTGKTSLVQSVASKVNMNVAIISLSGKMDDENFAVMLREVPRNSILVMEDIDHCVIKDPSSSGDDYSARITMSGLLNALDGVVAQEGSMIFMTCNDITRIQPALLRPGRIDMKMELGYADKDQIQKMFWRFMGKDDDIQNDDEQKTFVASEELTLLSQKFTDMIPDLYVTPAELQNFFIMNMMDREDETDDEESKTKDYSYLIESIPSFLASVKMDREQAKDHEIRNSKQVQQEAPKPIENAKIENEDKTAIAKEENAETVNNETK